MIVCRDLSFADGGFLPQSIYALLFPMISVGLSRWVHDMMKKMRKKPLRMKIVLPVRHRLKAMTPLPIE
jgi:hypothetical protein